MTPAQPRYGAQETVRRAEELYAQRIRPQVEAQHRGRYIAIDIETGEYEVGDDYHAAARSLLARKPSAALGALRIGYATVGRIGGRTKAVRQ